MAAFSAQDLRTIDVAPAAPTGRVNPHAKELNRLADAVTRQVASFLVELAAADTTDLYE